MMLTIDKSGRIVVPKCLREQLGSEIELVERPEGILMRPAESKPSMKKVDGIWVHQSAAKPCADWDSALDGAREERMRSILKLQESISAS